MEENNLKYYLCTLFDSNYLDKGLVLYESLCRNASNFELYILALDDKCYEVLMALQKKHIKVIKLSDFENDDLLQAKKNRSIAEYCWTCSSSLIKYVLDNYSPDYCSYIDCDMYFYGDPYSLIQEMITKGASVSIIGHRFPWYEQKRREAKVGKYCVECNTFKNDSKARGLLDIWISQCLDCCSTLNDGIHWGDQKYLDNWTVDYDFVIESTHYGAGVAPWNISCYSLLSKNEDNYILKYKGKKVLLLFYHFENIEYIDRNTVNTNLWGCWGIDYNLYISLYEEYLYKLFETKELLRKLYNIDVILKHHPVFLHVKKQNWLNKIILKIFHFDIKGIILYSIPRRLYRNRRIIHLVERK